LDVGARQVDLRDTKTIKSGFGGGPFAAENATPTIFGSIKRR
jgi:hypothetical protein